MARGVLDSSGDRRGARVGRAIADTPDTASTFGGERNVDWRDFEQQFVQRAKRADYGAEVEAGVSAIGAGFAIGESLRRAVRLCRFAAECAPGRRRCFLDFDANNQPGYP